MLRRDYRGMGGCTRLDKITLDITTRRWLYLHPERPDPYAAIAVYGQQHVHTNGNVYVGVCLYRREAKRAWPRRSMLWLGTLSEDELDALVDDRPDASILLVTQSIALGRSVRWKVGQVLVEATIIHIERWRHISVKIDREE